MIGNLVKVTGDFVRSTGNLTKITGDTTKVSGNLSKVIANIEVVTFHHLNISATFSLRNVHEITSATMILKSPPPPLFQRGELDAT